MDPCGEPAGDRPPLKRAQNGFQTSINSLLANTGDTWDDLQSFIADSGGAAQQMADTQLDNLSGQITILKSAVEGLAIQFGEIFLPMVKNVVSIMFLHWWL